MSEKQRIGWIGLGKMGTPMSGNLLKAGFPLSVYDIIEERVRILAEQGARSADSLKALAADAEVVISMIPDDRALEAVSIAPDGAFQGARAGAIYIDMSTVSPSASARLADAAKAKGIRYLRAPVSGSTALAAAGTLTIFASGPKDAYDQCREIFLALGQKSYHVGTGEQARYLKLVLNIMVGLTAAVAAEALSFGEKGGMDWDQMIEIVTNSVVASPLIGYKAKALKERNFVPAFTAAQMAKDLDIAMDTGRSMDQPLPLVSMVRQFLGAMKAQGKGELDFFGLLTLWEEMGNIKP